jgi:hypothetical protein
MTGISRLGRINYLLIVQELLSSFSLQQLITYRTQMLAPISAPVSLGDATDQKRIVVNDYRAEKPSLPYGFRSEEYTHAYE